jgi:hypothetical protein
VLRSPASVFWRIILLHNSEGEFEMICIDQLSVREAVLALHTMRPGDSPLTDLQLVHEILDNPTFPGGNDSRQFALNLLLTRTITRAFAHQRRVVEGTILTPNETLAEALDAIAVDSQHENCELLAWGWLYYHYVRVDLDIAVSDFCKAAALHPRTLRRYQQRGIIRLTYQLLLDEQRARTFSMSNRRENAKMHKEDWNAERNPDDALSSAAESPPARQGMGRAQARIHHGQDAAHH